MPTDDLMAWLGPAADEMTPEQIERVADAARRIEAFYPDPDQQDVREAALSAVVQHLLGEITPEAASRTLTAAALAEARARAAAVWLGVMLVDDGSPKATSARAVGVDRMTLLEALGERPRRRKG